MSWGHKLNLSIYVKDHDVAMVVECLGAQLVLPPSVDSMGMSVEVVEERPSDMVTS